MAATKINKTVGKIFTGLHGVIYKISGGKLGGSMGDGGVIALLLTTGAKTGKERTTPLIAVPAQDGWTVIASYSGHDVHPGWYHNLVADPQATLVIGKTEHPVTAQDLTGEARDKAWDIMAGIYADYEAYEDVTDREIPVLYLAPR